MEKEKDAEAEEETPKKKSKIQINFFIAALVFFETSPSNLGCGKE
jgi:hypothetical protein